jgi:hypothetical protein
MALLLRNAAALTPSIFVPQLISRNDGSSSTEMMTLISKHLRNHDYLVQNGAPDCSLIWNSAGCEPSFDGNRDAMAGFVSIRDQTNEAAANGGPPVIDAPAVVGDTPSAPWRYRAGMANPGEQHTNYAGAAAITPLAVSSLQKVL